MEPAQRLPEPRPSGVPDQAGGRDRGRRSQHHQRRGPGQQDEEMADRGDHDEDAHHPQHRRDRRVGDVTDPKRLAELQGRERIHAEQGPHDRAGEPRRGGDQQNPVGEPACPHDGELDEPDRDPRQAPSVPANRGRPDLNEPQDHEQCPGDPERRPVDARSRSTLAQVGRHQGIAQVQDQLEQPQPGVPQRQHRRRPAVREELERVEHQMQPFPISASSRDGRVR